MPTCGTVLEDPAVVRLRLRRVARCARAHAALFPRRGEQPRRRARWAARARRLAAVPPRVRLGLERGRRGSLTRTRLTLCFRVTSLATRRGTLTAQEGGLSLWPT
eukprot:6914639-Prymnesium_polylepis.1